MDFLGLRNLDVISDCLELIKDTKGVELDIDAIELDDQPTFELLKRGETIGVFHSSPHLRALIRRSPRPFDDVAALVALYRLGPMAANMHNDYADRKNGRKPVEFIHPDAEELLGDTYGLMIYQESVMRMAQKFAGYSLAEADSSARRWARKSAAMEKEREKFTTGVVEQGYDQSLAVEMFDIIAQFADYAFNKSHLYGYGYVAYQIAYLKANHPVEYLSALLTSVKSKLESAAVYSTSAASWASTSRCPTSTGRRWTSHAQPRLGRSLREGDQRGATPGSIIFECRRSGTSARELSRRFSRPERGWPLRVFIDFVERVEIEALNKRTIESLIKGVLDCLGHPRALVAGVRADHRPDGACRKEHDMGVMSLFGEPDDGLTNDHRFLMSNSTRCLASRTKGDARPLHLRPSIARFEAQVRRKADTVAGLADTPDGAIVKVGGVITNLQRKWTRKGDLMAVFELEDLEGSVEVMVFLARCRSTARSSRTMRSSWSGDAPRTTVIVEDVRPGHRDRRRSERQRVRPRLSAEDQKPERIDELKLI